MLTNPGVILFLLTVGYILAGGTLVAIIGLVWIRKEPHTIGQLTPAVRLFMIGLWPLVVIFLAACFCVGFYNGVRNSLTAEKCSCMAEGRAEHVCSRKQHD